MKKTKNSFISMIVSILLICLVMVGFSVVQAASEVKDGGDFYTDFPESKDTLLGAAGYFHIFANEAHLRSHTNGNVSARQLSGTANFGTQGILGTEPNYIQKVIKINGASGVQGHTKMVFGKDTRIDLSEFNRPKVNGRQMDRITGDDIYQDRNGNFYLDFDEEFKKLEQASSKLIKKDPIKIFVNKDFKNDNEREIDVSKYSGSDIYIQLAPEVLKKNTPLTIKGLEKNNENGDFKNVYIIVETDNDVSYTVKSQIKFQYTDGSNRGNKESVDFSDSTVLWTFMYDEQPFKGDINLESTWLGSILAPKASLGGGQNIDGNIIVNHFKGAGETHGWNFQENKKGSVILRKTSSVGSHELLKGAVFDLYKVGNEVATIKNLTTDDKGEIKVTGLIPGDYYFKEVIAPKGYILKDKNYYFTIKPNGLEQIEIVQVSNEPEEELFLGEVRLIKVDADIVTNRLNGAVFGLYEIIEGEEPILIRDNLTTSGVGELKISNLKEGKYHFKELVPPEGFERSEKIYPFEITKKTIELIESIVIPVPNEELYSISLKKVDKDNHKLFLAGAEFSLLKADGTVIADKLVTDSEGKIVYGNLSPGDYKLVETKAPKGYIIAKEDLNFTINETELFKTIYLTAENEKEKGSVELTKIDNVTKEFLSGAEFSLYAETGELLQENLMVDSEGKLIVSDLDIGNYYFVETKAPTGYELSTRKLTFKIETGKTGELVQLTAENVKEKSPEKGKVELTKVDSVTKEFLSGAEFSLYTETGEMLQENLMVDSEGKLIVSDLDLGNYYFIETKAPLGYELSTDKWYFQIETGKIEEIVKITVDNFKERIPEEEKGKVILTKTDQDNAAIKLSGAVFSLYTSTGELLQEGIKTDSNGQLTVDNLAVGSYYFVETNAPSGYLLSSEKIYFEIITGQTSIPAVVSAKNQKEILVGSVILEKVDSKNTEIKLQGAVFALYKDNGELIYSDLVTNEFGILRIDNLEQGDYYFMETTAPTGYAKASKKYDFTIQGSASTEVVMLQATNEKELNLGSVILRKTDQENSQIVLSGAEFNLYTEFGDLVYTNLVTNSIGELTVGNLTPGNYYFIETKAPRGYELLDITYPFTIKENKIDEIAVVEVTNVLKNISGSVQLSKVDGENTSEFLKDAEFSLYTDSGELVHEGLTTNELGIIKVDNLSLGSYYFIETKAPIGYEISTEKYKFEITETNSVDTINIQAVNFKIPIGEPDTGLVRLVKVDKHDEKKVLKDAEFALYTETGVLYKDGLKTNELGQIEITGLKVGRYYFIETKAPYGYQKSNQKYYFDIEVKEVSEITLVKATNEKKSYLGTVELIKTDKNDNNHSLEGAEFSLYQEDGKVIKAGLITNKDGRVVVGKLVEGNYYFVETKAPKGYKKSDEKYQFEIRENQNNIMQVVRATNEPIEIFGAVELIKIDESDNKKLLKGAEFSLYDEQGNLLLEKLQTNDEGSLVVEKLTEGKYYFVETKSPTGYELSKEKHRFEVNNNIKETLVRVTVTNKKVPTKPVTPISPTTKTGKVLPKTGESLDYLVWIGWTLIIGMFVVYWKKKLYNNRLD